MNGECLKNGCMTDVEQTQNGCLRVHDGHLRMHNGLLKMYDEIVDSKIHVSVYVTFSYCNHIAHERSGIEKSQIDGQ